MDCWGIASWGHLYEAAVQVSTSWESQYATLLKSAFISFEEVAAVRSVLRAEQGRNLDRDVCLARGVLSSLIGDDDLEPSSHPRYSSPAYLTWLHGSSSIPDCARRCPNSKG